MAKKTKKTDVAALDTAVPPTATSSSVFTPQFTFIRQLTGDEDRKPDAILFASPDPIDSALELKLLNHPDVVALFSGRPLMGIYYFNQNDEEHRLLITSNSYYTPSFADKTVQDQRTQNLHITYQDEAHASSTLPAGHVAGKLVTVNFKDRLDGCFEMWRPLGCVDCPFLGEQCISKNLDYRPWFFSLAYNRKDVADANLTDKGTNVQDRENAIVKVEVAGKNWAAVQKEYSTKTIEGFTYIDPSKTKPNETNTRFSQPLRPANEISFSPSARLRAQQKSETK